MARKTFTILIIIFSLAYSVKAEFRYGIRIGGIFPCAHLNNTEDYTIKNKSGFSGGLLFEYQDSKSGLAADLGMVYTSYKIILNNIESKINPGSNNIELPIHLKYKFWLSKTNNLVAPMIYAGPSFLFNLDKHDNLINTKIVNSGIDVGIGLDIINFIQISGGYRFGIGNMINKTSEINDVTLRQNGWNFSIALLFDF